MLSDPITVTYNSVSTDLARGSGVFPNVAKVISQTCYNGPGGELVLRIQHSTVSGGHRRTEILLGKRNPSADYDPFDREPAANYVGLVFITDKNRAEPADLDLLDSCLRAFVDDTLRDRIDAGEE